MKATSSFFSQLWSNFIELAHSTRRDTSDTQYKKISSKNEWYLLSLYYDVPFIFEYFMMTSLKLDPSHTCKGLVLPDCKTPSGTKKHCESIKPEGQTVLCAAV